MTYVAFSVFKKTVKQLLYVPHAPHEITKTCYQRNVIKEISKKFTEKHLFKVSACDHKSTNRSVLLNPKNIVVLLRLF